MEIPLTATARRRNGHSTPQVQPSNRSMDTSKPSILTVLNIGSLLLVDGKLFLDGREIPQVRILLDPIEWHFRRDEFDRTAWVEHLREAVELE
jgi:hypothetical protein